MSKVSLIMTENIEYTKPFQQLGLDQIGLVGGKNASLGEMISSLSSLGIKVPDGFATTADAYSQFLMTNHLVDLITDELERLDRYNFTNLGSVGSAIRSLILEAKLPEPLGHEVRSGFENLKHQYGLTFQWLHAVVRLQRIFLRPVLLVSRILSSKQTPPSVYADRGFDSNY